MVKKPARPKKISETQYRKKLRQIIAELRNVLKNSQTLTSSDVTKALIEARRKERELKERYDVVALSMTSDVERRNRKENRAFFIEAIGINLAKLMDKKGIRPALNRRVKENVSLIRSVTSEILQRTEDTLWRHYNGQAIESLNVDLGKIFKNADNRVRIIARDQTAKFNSQLNQIRQTNVGIKRYTWRTSDDERVRPSHQSNDDEIFEWDSPPSGTGHPGDDILCRCYAEPVIEDILN